MRTTERKSTKICNDCHQEYHIDELQTEIKQQSLPGCRKQIYLCSDCV